VSENKYESPAIVEARLKACHDIGKLFCWCVEHLQDFPPIEGEWIDEVLRRLAADAQRAKEDAEPITEEWLRSVGFYPASESGRIYHHNDVQGYFYLDELSIWQWNCEVYHIGDFIRRGQVRKLLEALDVKGCGS
jgi:hypothetical protein